MGAGYPSPLPNLSGGARGRVQRPQGAAGPVVEEAAASRLGAALGGGGDRFGGLFRPPPGG